MRVAVLADTHWKGSDSIPAQVLDLLEDVDVVIHAGDIKCQHVLADLGKQDRQVLAVRGDSFELDLADLPDTRVEEINGYTVGIAHDIGAISHWTTFKRKPEEVFGQKVDAVVFGHTHHPFFDVIHGVRFINPGSATDQDHSGTPGTLALLNIDGQINRVEFVQI
jgi:putative phosphoesterase